ncbi:MAG: hypothetical protein ACFCGT_19930 [Sandaracinaceae bacterium]
MSDGDEGTIVPGSFDAFLRAAIKGYWEKGGDRANVIALLLASREAWEVAFDELARPSTGRRLLTGAAGVTAVVVLLRAVLGGPVGLILTGASVASLAALYARNHGRIWAQQERYRGLIGVYRVKHQQVRAKFVDGTIDQDERDLMLDGLLRRFLEELDQPPPKAESPEDAEPGSEPSGGEGPTGET